MLSSRSSQIPRQVKPTWVPELHSQLQRVFTLNPQLEAREFPDILIRTLSSGDTSLDAEEIDRIASIITRDVERVTKTLRPVSLRTLASLLLRSYSQHAQNIGLDLLLEASRGSGSDAPGHYLGKSDKPMVDQALGRCLYLLFNNEDQEVFTRKLAGKLLLAVMTNVEEIHDELLRPSQAELARTTYILKHDTDQVLRFFASTILTNFCRCGINIPNTPETQHRFLESVRASPYDTIRSFCYHETQQTKKEQHPDQKRAFVTTQCHLLQSLHMGEAPVVNGPIVASLTVPALTFIYAVDDTPGGCFDFLEVPWRAILEISALTIDSTPTLVLTTDASMITVSGTSNRHHGRSLRLTSKTSLRDLEAAIYVASGSRRKEVREGVPITRKSSSTLIPLDLGEEISRKSAQENGVERDMTPDCKHHSVANGQTAGHVAQAAGETTRNEEAGQGGQSQTVSENASTIVYQDAVPGISEMQPSPSPGYREELQAPASPGKTISTREHIETCEAEAIELQSINAAQAEKIPRNTVDQTDQDAPRSLPYRLRSLSNKQHPLCQPTNTQESLMFHRRKPGQKVYTSHSKAAVAWDEDLQPSGDNKDGTFEQETITSISSPFPGDVSIFDGRKSSTGKRKGGPVGNASFKKKRKTNPKPRKKNVGTKDLGDERLRASRRGKNGSKTDDAEFRGAKESQTGTPAPKLQGDHDPLASHDQRPRGSRDLEVRDTNTTLKATVPHVITELVKDNTCANGVALVVLEENPGVGNALYRHTHEEHDDTFVIDGCGPRGRGKAVGEKLAAAFNDLDTRGSQDPSERRVCDEAARKVVPSSNSTEGLESVHSPALSRIHQDSTQRQKPTLPRSPCRDTLESLSPRLSVRRESDGPDVRARSVAFFDPSHAEVPRMGESRPNYRAAQRKTSLSAEGKNPNASTGDDAVRDTKDAVQRRRSLPKDVRRIPAPFLQRRRSTPKRIMVDKNGSPKMIRHGETISTSDQENSIQSKGELRINSFQLVFQSQGKGDESGYDGRSDTDATQEAPERDTRASSPLCYTSPAQPLLERAAASAGTLDGLDIDRVVQTDSKSTDELLETAHKRTQSMLLASSERLARQLEDEKHAVNRVLEAYQRQCHQVLDELFKAQEERMRLCEQQTESIRAHHARICRGLIDRLEANGRRAQKRTLPDLPASQGSERSQLRGDGP